MKMQELLTIDPQFKNLIPPLQRTEYLPQNDDSKKEQYFPCYIGFSYFFH